MLVTIKVISTKDPPIEPIQMLWLAQQKELNKINDLKAIPCLEKSAHVATDEPTTVINSKKWFMLGKVMHHINTIKNHITLRD